MSENPVGEKFFPVRNDNALEGFREKKGNVLVIAPHPDDDVLGAGGTMAACSGEGKGVFSVYLTDGRGSLRGDTVVPDAGVAAVRQREALSALDKVGAVGGFFLAFGSEELCGEGGGKAARELTEICRYLLPENIFLPAPYERHPTHQRCTQLALQALRSIPPFSKSLLGYSIWGSFWGGHKRVFRDITPFIRKKVDGVMAHASQIANKNYQQGVLGKNNYEAIFWESHEPQKASFAEIFLDMIELLEKRDLSLGEFMRRDLERFTELYLPER